MARKSGKLRRHGGLSVALACGCAVLALGGTGIALAAVGGATQELPAGFAPFTPASVDPGLARFVAEHGGNSHLMRFTPAGTAGGFGRSITVAVRIDNQTARAISVRSAISSANEQLSGTAIEIAPTRFDLGIARGYRSFAQAKPIVPVAPTQLADIAMPDLAEFRPSPVAKGQPSRFSARLALEKDQKKGRAEGTLESFGEQTFDLGGAVRVARNLDVTAGVRYSQDRDRIAPLTDGEQDSQAVYVGTQFRF
jgi:hypothetical protein